jgi:hypothetical protein
MGTQGGNVDAAADQNRSPQVSNATVRTSAARDFRHSHPGHARS